MNIHYSLARIIHLQIDNVGLRGIIKKNKIIFKIEKKKWKKKKLTENQLCVNAIERFEMRNL